VCTNRFFVHEKVYDAFAEKFAAKVRSLKVGPGTEPGVTRSLHRSVVVLTELRR